VAICHCRLSSLSSSCVAFLLIATTRGLIRPDRDKKVRRSQGQIG
ncbi:hypothetical protein RB213_011308, partial [Colletotrichum asianum]